MNKLSKMLTTAGQEALIWYFWSGFKPHTENVYFDCCGAPAACGIVGFGFNNRGIEELLDNSISQTEFEVNSLLESPVSTLIISVFAIANEGKKKRSTNISLNSRIWKNTGQSNSKYLVLSQRWNLTDLLIIISV